MQFPRVSRRVQAYAFSRIDLVVILGACGLLAVVAVSGRANVAVASDKTVCLNNLRQIGRAFQIWASDHGDQYPLWVDAVDGGLKNPPATLVVPGIGSFPSDFRSSAWFQFLWINRELQTPTVLVCPADQSRGRANDFSTSLGGYSNGANKDIATSYAIWMDMSATLQHGVVVSDGNLDSMQREICAVVNLPGSRFNFIRDPVTSKKSSWTDMLHNGSGNMFFNEGRAEDLSTSALYSHFRAFEIDGARFHLAVPQ